MMSNESPTTVKLGARKRRGVRLAFPKLFTPEAFGPGAPEKYQATFLIENDDEETLTEVRAAMNAAGADMWPKTWNDPKFRKQVNIRGLQDGDKKSQYDGFEDHHYVGATSADRPTLVDSDRTTPLVEADGRPYSGCYVVGMVDFWAQDNQYGKAINASLLGVMFLRDGKSFGGAKVAGPDAFADIEDDDDPMD
jgi:hypothetical protein